MKYPSILVTGGAGFIGSHLVDHFVKQGIHVRILDCLIPQIHPEGKMPKYINPNADFIKGDVTNKNDWKKALVGIDAVIHLAASVGVGQSMYQIGRYVKDNCLGTAILLDILANEKHTIKKILVTSSMTIYGEGMYNCPKCLLKQQGKWRNKEDVKKGMWEPLCIQCHTELMPIPTDETAQQQSPSVYAITKKTQEELILSVGKAYQIPAVVLRLFNALGPRQSLSNPYCGVAAIFLSRVKNGQSPILNEDGNQTRDFIYVSDIIEAIDRTLHSSKADFEIFNVGSGVPTTIKKVADVVFSLQNSHLQSEITEKFRAFDIRHCFADLTKLQNLIGWKPRVSFVEGMQKVFEWSKTESATDHVEIAIQELSERGLI